MPLQPIRATDTLSLAATFFGAAAASANGMEARLAPAISFEEFAKKSLLE
jgi:hypothetical protein